MPPSCLSLNLECWNNEETETTEEGKVGHAAEAEPPLAAGGIFLWHSLWNAAVLI